MNKLSLPTAKIKVFETDYRPGSGDLETFINDMVNPFFVEFKGELVDMKVNETLAVGGLYHHYTLTLIYNEANEKPIPKKTK